MAPRTTVVYNSLVAGRIAGDNTVALASDDRIVAHPEMEAGQKLHKVNPPIAYSDELIQIVRLELYSRRLNIYTAGIDIPMNTLISATLKASWSLSAERWTQDRG